MPSSDKVCSGPNDYYVLLRWIEKEKRFQGFMLTGTEARKEVHRNEHGKWNTDRRMKGKATWAATHVGPRAEGRDDKWEKYWEMWTIP
jgi:hypothetical protein